MEIEVLDRIEEHAKKETISKRKRKNSQLVVHSNDLIEAWYDSDLTSTEHKVVKYASSKITPNGRGFPDCTITVKELMEVLEIRSNNFHKQIEKIGDGLSRKRIKLKTSDKSKFGWFPWFSAILYKQGVLELSFNPLLEDLIYKIDSSKGYTKYYFDTVKRLRSGHAIRLYEILKQYAPIGKRMIPIEELKNMMGLQGKYENGFGPFRLRVLEPAKKEINEHTPLTIEYTPLKRGRSYEIIEFLIESKETNNRPKELPEKEEVGEEKNEFYQKAKILLKKIHVEITDTTLRQLGWEQYGIDLLEETVFEIEDKIETINKPLNYISVVLKAKRKDNKTDKEDKRRIDDNTTQPKENNEKDVYRVLYEFTLEQKRVKEVIPFWMIKEDAIAFFRKNLSITKEEADSIWDRYEGWICTQLNIDRQR